jgi:hypothetical protein
MCVNHDGEWRRINKDLIVMNHTSEKSKQESWRWGTRCNGEGQVDIWVQSINQAMESHIALSVDIYWIKKSSWHGQEEKPWLYKSKKSIVTGSRQSCLSQYHVETLKLWQRWRVAKGRIKLINSSLFLSVFISFLSIGRHTMKRDVTWWSWQNQSTQNL